MNILWFFNPIGYFLLPEVREPVDNFIKWNYSRNLDNFTDFLAAFSATKASKHDFTTRALDKEHFNEMIDWLKERHINYCIDMLSQPGIGDFVYGEERQRIIKLLDKSRALEFNLVWC